MGARIRHVDIAKGMSILLVAFNHSQLQTLLPELSDHLSLVRMPLFFFLSGIFFSHTKPPMTFFLNKVDALLKPYMFVMCTLVVFGFLFGPGGFFGKLKGVLYGNGDTLSWPHLWFLTHLFFLYSFSYVVNRYAKFHMLKRYTKLLILLVSISIGAKYIDLFWYREIAVSSYTFVLPGLPFSADIVFVSGFFFLLGSIFKEQAIEFEINFLVLLGCLCLCVSIMFFTNANINLNKRVYAFPLFATVGAITGIYVVMAISKTISRCDRLSTFFESFGAASLFILIFHPLIQSSVYRLLAADSSGEMIVTHATLAFILSVVLPVGMKWLVEKCDLLALAFLPLKTNRLYLRYIKMKE